MRLEFDISGKKAARIAVVVLIGVVIGYALGATITLPVGNPLQGNCLTTADLNRNDLGNTIVLTSQASRFCEGIGFVSAVRWEQDEQGQVYGVPVCIRPQ